MIIKTKKSKNQKNLNIEKVERRFILQSLLIFIADIIPILLIYLGDYFIKNKLCLVLLTDLSWTISCNIIAIVMITINKYD